MISYQILIADVKWIKSLCTDTQFTASLFVVYGHRCMKTVYGHALEFCRSSLRNSSVAALKRCDMGVLKAQILRVPNNSCSLNVSDEHFYLLYSGMKALVFFSY